MNKTVTSQRQIIIKRRYIKHSVFLKASAPVEAVLAVETRQEATDGNTVMHSGSISIRCRHLSVLLYKGERQAHLEVGESSTEGAPLPALPTQDIWGEQASDLVTSFGDGH